MDFNMKKLTILIIAVLATIILLIGCSVRSHEQGYADYEQYMADSIGLLGAARHYDVQSFRLEIDVDFRQIYLFIHQEQLYTFLLEVDEDTLNSYIHLFRMDADGSNLQEIYRTLLDENVDFFNILGFEKHDDDYISLVSTDSVILPPYTREDVFDGLWYFDIVYTYVYRRISPYGEVVTEFGIESLNSEERQITISDIAFDLNGNVAASVSWLPADIDISNVRGMIPEGVGGWSFFLFDNGLTGDFHEVEDLTFSMGQFNRTSNGQIIMPSVGLSHNAEPIMYYEVDFENIAIIDGSVVGAEAPIDSISGVFPAPQTSVFDFYLTDNDRDLVGYRKSDGSFIPLIDFLELGVPLDHGMLDRNSFLLWDDGREFHISCRKVYGIHPAVCSEMNSFFCPLPISAT